MPHVEASTGQTLTASHYLRQHAGAYTFATASRDPTKIISEMMTCHASPHESKNDYSLQIMDMNLSNFESLHETGRVFNAIHSGSCGTALR